MNKQIHVEVKDILTRAGTNYHVDIMFVKSYGLWTTWSIPAPPRTPYIDCVRASIRLFEPTPDLDARFRGSLSFRPGDGGPPSAVWSFYTLLTGVLNHGPGIPGEQSWKDCESRYACKRIVIDVLAPTDKHDYKGILWEDDNNMPPGLPWPHLNHDAPGGGADDVFFRPFGRPIWE